MKKFACANVGSCGELLQIFFGEVELVQRNKLQTIFRADVHAPSAEDTFAAVHFGAFKNRVDPTLQATRSFLPRFRLGETNFDFSDASTAFEGNHRYVEP